MLGIGGFQTLMETVRKESEFPVAQMARELTSSMVKADRRELVVRNLCNDGF
jgi:hypothetical protein